MASMTVKEALNQLRKRILIPSELLGICHQRLQQTKLLNHIVDEIDEGALNQCAKVSEEAYAGGKYGPLEGIPIVFKDNYCTVNFRTTCASKMLLNYRPPYNAAMVEKVSDAGGVVVGKANMDEFGMGAGNVDSFHGPVVNPWSLCLPRLESGEDDFYIAGGSSGGSAAAVASGSCLAAFGSDTGGSTRNPASFCGVAALKPTYGLLSRHGLIPLVNSLDCPGIMAKTVEDIAIVLNVVAGHDVRDSTSVQENHAPFIVDETLDISKLHVAIPREVYSPNLSEEMATLLVETADVLEKAGAKVREVSMPHFQHSLVCYMVLCCTEVASNFSRYTGVEFGLRSGSEESTEELFADSRHEGFNDVVRGRIFAGNFFVLGENYETIFKKAQRIRRLIFNDFQTQFSNGVNYLLAPTVLSDAPEYKWFSEKDNRSRCAEQDILTFPANLAGVPAVTVPWKLSKRGLPLGLQLMGPHFSESSLLSLAHWMEKEAGFKHLDLSFLDLSESVNP